MQKETVSMQLITGNPVFLQGSPVIPPLQWGKVPAD
jgi:hypothetical protein